MYVHKPGWGISWRLTICRSFFVVCFESFISHSEVGLLIDKLANADHMVGQCAA